MLRLRMNLPSEERRRRKRLPIEVPVSIKTNPGRPTETGYTRDLSESGVFLYTNSQVAEGSELEMVLILPAEITGGDKRWVCCQASVVRVEDEATVGRRGVAADIHRMEVLPEISK